MTRSITNHQREGSTPGGAAGEEQVLLDQLEIAVAVWDRDDRLILFNHRYRDLVPELASDVKLGARFEALTYRAIDVGAVKSAKSDAKGWLRRHLARHSTPGDPFDVSLSDGRTFRVSEARLPGGRTVTSWRDTSGETVRDRELSTSENRFHTLLELVGDPVFVLSDGKVAFVNQAGADLLGAASRNKPVGDRFEELLVPEPDEEANGDSDTAPVSRFRTRDGRSLWLETRYGEVEGEGRRFELVAIRDMTARLNAEAEAENARDSLAAALEVASETIALFDSEDRLVLANRASRDLESPVAEAWRPGIGYESYLRAAVAAGLYPAAEGREADWITERLAQRAAAAGPVEIGRQDGRWLLLSEERLPDGGAISIGTDITARKLAEHRAHFLAHHDGLTGLPNRALFKDRLEQAISQASRAGRKVAVLLFDLDGFKHINDDLGHSAGDRLLIEVSSRLRACARGGDTVARLGGDEFAVVQPLVTGTEQASALAERAQTALAEPIVIDGQPIHTGASIGITLYPDDARDIEGLMKDADLALYRAKELAGGQTAFYANELGKQAEQMLATGEGLRDALANDRFVLHYQPKVRLSDGAVVGGEALLRWNHPQRGLLSPAAFIEHAEATGLIRAIGEWAIDHTCGQISNWARKGALLVPIWVNVSAAQFHDQSLLEKVRTTLLGAGVEPRMLGLEITETALMPDVAASTATLDRLVELGVELSIDDFGTGYSSLNYLKLFPVGKLKIDKSFVDDITTNPLDSAIARAIIHLGHSLGMHVLAEGVETEQQSNLLSDLGCDQIQGLLISPPLPADEFVRFVAAKSGAREPRL